MDVRHAVPLKQKAVLAISILLKNKNKDSFDVQYVTRGTAHKVEMNLNPVEAGQDH